MNSSPASPSAVRGLPRGPSRRRFLRSTGLALGGLAVTGAERIRAEGVGSKTGVVVPPGFRHRALNGWITDLATEPDPIAAWPSMRLDEALLDDYRMTFKWMRRFRWNEVVIWGLYVANSWPTELSRAVTAERGRMVERLIGSAHEHGIRVLSGLGTYSWGFADILKAHPELGGGNPNALCPAKSGAHAWMERIVDFMFARFPIDGVSMQSADQGRCRCSDCAKLGDTEYHAALLTRTAAHIRSRHAGKTVGMSNWGLPFDRREDLALLARTSGSLDYMIDQNDSARRVGAGYRKELVQAMAGSCAFGTSGGPVVEPPQHWGRYRWILPTARRVHEHLGQLRADGGGACEFFQHQRANPSSEFTFQVALRSVAQPERSLGDVAAETVEELYSPRTMAARDALAQWFLAAEDAYCRHLPEGFCGTISLEPLAGDFAGPPVYLQDRLKREARKAYGAEISRLDREFEAFQGDLRSPERVDRIRVGLHSVQVDLRKVGDRQ